MIDHNLILAMAALALSLTLFFPYDRPRRVQGTIWAIIAFLNFLAFLAGVIL